MTTKLNVLQVIPKLGYGGAETGCYDLAHYLPEKECKSYIATNGGELLKFVKKEKVKIIKENEREITKISSQFKVANNQFVPSIIKSCYDANTNTMNPIDSPECGGITNDYALALMPDGSYIPRAKTGEDSYAAIRSTISELNNFNFY